MPRNSLRCVMRPYDNHYGLLVRGLLNWKHGKFQEASQVAFNSDFHTQRPRRCHRKQISSSPRRHGDPFQQVPSFFRDYKRILINRGGSWLRIHVTWINKKNANEEIFLGFPPKSVCTATSYEAWANPCVKRSRQQPIRREPPRKFWL